MSVPLAFRGPVVDPVVDRVGRQAGDVRPGWEPSPHRSTALAVAFAAAATVAVVVLVDVVLLLTVGPAV